MVQKTRLAITGEDGIAIGAILFVIAVLAILAVAIASSSSTFSSSSTQETSRTNAAEMISPGQNMKLGVDRMVSIGTRLDNTVINEANTT